jgi:small subunit ribosomal protein S21
MAYDTKKDSKDKIRIDISDSFGAERALKKFKRLCDAYGIVKEYRAREAYQKPSVKNKLKLEAADKRRKKTDSKSRGSKKF